MPNLSEYNKYGEELEKRLQLKTFLFAVKLLKKAEDIPEGAVRPKKDLGSHLALCQGFSLSRRDGQTVAMMKEDNWCYAPMIALGFGEPPEHYLEGHTDFPARVTSLEAARNIEQIPYIISINPSISRLRIKNKEFAVLGRDYRENAIMSQDQMIQVSLSN